MFANILRTQARVALTSCRVHVPAFSVSRVAPRFPSLLSSASPASRAISTSRPVWNLSSSAQGEVESNTLYVGNLPFSITEEELKEKFEPFGIIKDVRLSYSPDGRSRGYAHVEYADVNDAITAYGSFKEEPLYLLDRDIRVDYATRRNRDAAQPSISLYFGNFSGTMDNLREITAEYQNSITNMFFLRDRETGEQLQSGFIHFNTVSEAEAALRALNNRTSGDAILNLRYAAPKRQRRFHRERREHSR
ncbi:hypothetical protein C0989_001768 [Termitomyces sp. Mn162]|nr:hypothetical protein C0989_001768 [Termitomyces sp. Mn162]